MCVDVDECQNNDGRCGSGTICVNNVGSYSCVCLPSYDRVSPTTCVKGMYIYKYGMCRNVVLPAVDCAVYVDNLNVHYGL